MARTKKAEALAQAGLVSKVMRVLGARTSARKAASSAANGRKGGRPRKASR